VPPFTHGRTLIYIAPKPGVVVFEYSETSLVELYGVDPEVLSTTLGPNTVELDAAGARARLLACVELMRTIQHEDLSSNHPVFGRRRLIDRTLNEASLGPTTDRRIGARPGGDHPCADAAQSPLQEVSGNDAE